jgi:PAS domain S-box-containing protein
MEIFKPIFERTPDALLAAQALLDSALDAMVIINEQGRIVLLNPKTEKMFGYTRSELWGQSVERLIPERFRKQHLQLQAGYFANPHVREMGAGLGLYGLRKDGAEFPVEISLSPFHTREGIFVSSAIRDVTERRRMEEDLRTSKHFIQAVTCASAPFIYLFDLDTMTVTYTNRSLLKELGYPATRLEINRLEDFKNFLPPEDLPHLQLVLKEWGGLQDGHFREDEYRLCDVEGVHRWFAGRETVFTRHSDGSVQQILGTLYDITERKTTEHAIRAIVESVHAWKGDEFFQSMALELARTLGANHTIIGELIQGQESKVRGLGVCINGAISENLVYELAGTPSEHAITKGVCSYPSGVAELFPQDITLQELSADGYVGIPLFDSYQRPLGVMAALFNKPLANPKLAESILQIFSTPIAAEIERCHEDERLRHAEERFSKAFRSSPVGFAITTLEDGRYVEANDAYLRMMEYERSELVGRTSANLHVWEDPSQRSRMVATLVAHGKVNEEQVGLRTKSGKILQVQISMEIIRLEGQQCLLSVTRDVTQQNLLEEQLRQSQKMEAIGRLAGGVAHDFNNLLGVILGYTEILATESAPASASGKKLAAIKNAAERAALLTTQLLAFSRKQPLQFKTVNLNDILRQTEMMLRRLIGEDIEFAFVQDSKLGLVKADPGQMVQIIMNLAVNARDAMPQGGKLTIETANITFAEGTTCQGVSVRSGPYVLLAVSDNGLGMNAETKARIFEPFFTTKPEGKGTGLGLATVYGVVKQSEGYIFVDSELGKGTTFNVFLPRIAAAVEVQPTAEPPASVELTQVSETILLVEDDQSLRDLLNDSLRMHGYHVLVATGGLHALQVAERHPGRIDALITDVIMPQMSGPELAKLLKATQPQLKVVYISGYIDDHTQILDPGIAFIQKPFELNQLAQKLREALDRRDSTSESV